VRLWNFGTKIGLVGYFKHHYYQGYLIDKNTSKYLNRSGSITYTQFYEDSEINKKFTCCVTWDGLKSAGLENCCWGGAPTAFEPEPGTGAAEVAETPIGVGACCEGTPVDCAVACWPCWAPPTVACCCTWVCWGGCCAWGWKLQFYFWSD
jgi:hypothetical protein